MGGKKKKRARVKNIITNDKIRQPVRATSRQRDVYSERSDRG